MNINKKQLNTAIQDRVNIGNNNFQDLSDTDYASVLQSIQAKKAAQKQRVSLWAEQRSAAKGNELAQSQASDSSFYSKSK